MKCKDCPNLYWFGDYALDICRISKDIVEPDQECVLTNEEDFTNEE